MMLLSTSMHQARIVLAVNGFEASVAQAPALRQTTTHRHPEPERVVTESYAWAAVAFSTRLMDLAASGPGPKDDVESMFNE